jgi:membrane fusion protein, multidrug efflux system
MKIKVIGWVLLAALLFAGCAGQEKTESKNMEQIYKEEGIPIEIKVMQPGIFIKELSYNAFLSGIRQSAAAAMIGGRIEKVNVNVGDYIEKGEVMFEFPEDAPAGQLTQARSAYQLSKTTYERMRNLYEKGGISKQELDTIETQYRVAGANLDAVMQMLKVRAPISGYVVSINVRETDGVQAENVLAFVSQTKQMKARIWATEDEICLIKKGHPAKVSWNDVTLAGEVTEVAIAMDRAHNAFAVDLVFENQENLCKSGVVGEIAIQVYKNDAAFTLDRSVVNDDEIGFYIFKEIDHTARRVNVKIGREADGFEILEGISSGDNVIVKGLNLVYDNAKVKVIN